jgi:hypothetical protein
MDAFYYNPATLTGQIYDGKSEDKAFVHQVLFPRASITMNENAHSLNSNFGTSGAMSNAQKGAEIIKNSSDQRQYARVSLSPVGLFIGNLGIAPLIDQQIAAVPQNTADSAVEFRHRSFSGLLVGSRVGDSKGYFSLGASTMIGSIEETYATAPYVDIVDVDKRQEILAANRKTYSSSGVNVGTLIRSPKKGNPSLSVVARNVGSTKNKSSSGESPLVYQEDLALGFGLAPALGKFGRLNLGLEAGALTNKEVSGSKKLRSSVELTIGSSEGSRSLLGLRAGGTSAGVSYGLHLNLGLLAFEVASQAIDVGLDNEKLIERRLSGTVYIDVASF